MQEPRKHIEAMPIPAAGLAASAQTELALCRGKVSSPVPRPHAGALAESLQRDGRSWPTNRRPHFLWVWMGLCLDEHTLQQ